MTIVPELRRLGLRLRLRGDGCLATSPLTDAQRAIIGSCKTEIMAELRREKIEAERDRRRQRVLDQLAERTELKRVYDIDDALSSTHIIVTVGLRTAAGIVTAELSIERSRFDAFRLATILGAGAPRRAMPDDGRPCDQGTAAVCSAELVKK